MTTMAVQNLSVLPVKAISRKIKTYKNTKSFTNKSPRPKSNMGNWSRRSSSFIDSNAFNLELNPNRKKALQDIYRMIDGWSHFGAGANEKQRKVARDFVEHATDVAEKSITGRTFLVQNIKELRDEAKQCSKTFKSKKFANKLWRALFVTRSARL